MSEEIQETSQDADQVSQGEQEGAGSTKNVQEEQQAGTVQELPDWAQTHIKELRQENAKHRTAKKTADKAAQEKDEERLAAQEKWQELAEQRGTRVTELESVEEQAKRYSKALGEVLEQMRKDVPDHIVALLDKIEDPVEQMQWLTNNAEVLGKPKPSKIDAATRGVDSEEVPASQEEVEAFAAQYDLDPRFVDPNQVPTNWR